jgi:chromosome condensin MukBEF ATPase and DNA-binding subunit MukB
MNKLNKLEELRKNREAFTRSLLTVNNVIENLEDNARHRYLERDTFLSEIKSIDEQIATLEQPAPQEVNPLEALDRLIELGNNRLWLKDKEIQRYLCALAKLKEYVIEKGLING